ncbi:MAG TPA: hypothetical protein IAC14_05285 [Candidatus Scybalomonas excrementigallinarum]|nr:hypothetical protein [Candidatus Scybalomonas excrementigallinarum]
MESFGKVISFFLITIILFIAPVYYMAIKQDSISQNYINKETADFVNTIRNTGSISKDTYNRFIKKLDATGNIYEIEIEHQHLVVNPVVDDNGNVTEDIASSYVSTYEDDIFKELFEGSGTYHFNKDDYVSVIVRNKNKTLATRVQEIVYQRELPTVQLVATFGGVIRDET